MELFYRADAQWGLRETRINPAANPSTE